MPNRRIKRGVKLAGVKLYEHGVLPLSTILDVLGYSRRTFFRTLKLWRETGDVVATPSSDVPARLGLKAAALAWLSTAQAFTILRPGQSRQ